MHHLHVVLVVVRLISELLFVVADQLSHSLLVPVFLVVESLFEALLLRLIEVLELDELLFGLRIDFLELGLVETDFFFQL